VTALFISLIYRDAWFVGFGASQHLTFQKEVLLIFEEFIFSHKVNLGNNNMFNVCGKNTIVFNLPQMGFLSLLEMCCIFQSWQIICYQLIS
jgi:hypothetical protein